jgi:hypothetical protein
MRMQEDPTVVEFRDGPRNVPEHVMAMLSGLDTHRMTYQQAIEAANRRMVGDQLQSAQDSMIQQHFKVNR